MSWMGWVVIVIIVMNVVFFGALYVIYLIEKGGLEANGNRKTDR